MEEPNLLQELEDLRKELADISAKQLSVIVQGQKEQIDKRLQELEDYFKK